MYFILKFYSAWLTIGFKLKNIEYKNFKNSSFKYTTASKVCYSSEL